MTEEIPCPYFDNTKLIRGSMHKTPQSL